MLTSEPKVHNLSELNIILSSQYARKEFANIIFQDKFNFGEKHLLDEENFNELQNLIFTSIIFTNNNEAEYGTIRLITKSLFFYYKKILKKNKIDNYFIYKEIIKLKGSFISWLDSEFWKDFLDSEIIENSNIIGNKFNNKDAYNFNIICKVINYMVDLNINCEFILHLFETISKKYITKVIIN